MKILVVSTNVFRLPVTGYSGLEHLAWQQATGLAARGHAVAVAAPDGSRCEGCEVVATGPAGTWDEGAAYAAYAGRVKEFDAVIDNSWSKNAYRAKLEGYPGPVLSVMHAPVDTMWRSLPPVEKPCVVCISDDQRRHFEALFSREARTCHNGVDPEFYKPTGAARGGRFLFLARFSSIKGADLAVRACLDAGAGLDLVGDTTITNEPDYLKQVTEAAAASSPGWDPRRGRQIRFVGPATRGECVHWFSQAHALLHPNQRFREPFGLAPVEAMLCGCPVVAWDYGAMRETVAPGCGHLVTSLAGLTHHVKALDSEGVTAAARDHCREKAMKFSAANMVARYEELIGEALATGGW